jgi:hypothetical protein
MFHGLIRSAKSAPRLIRKPQIPLAFDTKTKIRLCSDTTSENVRGLIRSPKSSAPIDTTAVCSVIRPYSDTYKTLQIPAAVIRLSKKLSALYDYSCQSVLPIPQQARCGGAGGGSFQKRCRGTQHTGELSLHCVFWEYILMCNSRCNYIHY